MILLCAGGLGATSCGSRNNDNGGDDLQALLHDDPLGRVATTALITEAAAAGPSGTAPGDVAVAGRSGGPVAGAGGAVMISGAGGAAGSFGGPGGRGGAGGFGTAGRPAEKDAGGDFDAFPPPPPPFPSSPLGQWSFDDCVPNRTNLFDSTFNNNQAFRAVTVACVAGIDGQGVALADKDNDIVYVPDQPNFTFENGVTVAGWFKPAATNDTRTLFRKRDDSNSSAFALLLNRGRFQFVVNLGNGCAETVVAPDKAVASLWTHVAATYDGMTIRLYLNGKQVAAKDAPGAIPAAPGPLLMGNDGSKRFMAGVIDSALFSARALSADEVFALTCLHNPAIVAVSPPASPPMTVGAPAAFDVAVTNTDSPACAAQFFALEAFSSQAGLQVSPTFAQFSLSPGETSHTTMTATGTDDLDTGSYPVSLSVFGDAKANTPASFQFNFVASGCRVSKQRELMITALSVVDDPIRTVPGDSSSDSRAGVWTFKRLMENIAPTAADAPRMVEDVLTSFNAPQTINGFNVDVRPGMQAQVLSSWPRTPNGELDLAQAPFTLQAIVDRFDLRDLSKGDAGEGRFVFAFNQTGTPFPLQATIIFEYKLPAKTDDDVLGWANAWHALGSLPFPSEDYNAALQAITDRFSGRGVRPDHVNGSAINAVRTNEIAFGTNGVWELREFGLSADTGRLVPATVKLTPDLGFNNSPTLASFINANEDAIIKETHTVPDQFGGAPFLGGAVFNDFFTLWNAPGLDNQEARFHFAVNTCNGCHSAETNTTFLQINPRFPGSEAVLSPFLNGTTVFDRFDGTVRTINDLARRQSDLRGIVCPPDTDGGMGGGIDGGGAGGAGGAGGGGIGGADAGRPPMPPGSGADGGTPGKMAGGPASPASGSASSAGGTTTTATTLEKGISRVH